VCGVCVCVCVVSVLALRCLIEKTFGVPRSRQRLAFNGITLNSPSTLAEYGLTSGATITLHSELGWQRGELERETLRRIPRRVLPDMYGLVSMVDLGLGFGSAFRVMVGVYAYCFNLNLMYKVHKELRSGHLAYFVMYSSRVVCLCIHQISLGVIAVRLYSKF